MTKLLAAMAIMCAPIQMAFAAQIVLTPANVIGGSATYGGTWDAGQFNATQVLNSQTTPPSEPSQTGYWLNPDSGSPNAYFVVDLGLQYQLGSVVLFNTHNANFEDRGTGDFTIIAGNSITNNGVEGFGLTGPTTTIVAGTLNAVSQANDPITGQSFDVTDLGGYRYLAFLPTSVASAGPPCCGTNVYGLNEILVFDAPEPATMALLGTCLLGIGLIRRKMVS